MRTMSVLTILALIATISAAIADDQGDHVVPFEKTELGEAHPCEAAVIVDVNRDGGPDVVCGTHWFENPSWAAHKMRELEPIDTYYNAFAEMPMDCNGDGFVDVVTCGWMNRTIEWYENPHGQEGLWEKHHIESPGNFETAMTADVDADGHMDILPNLPGGAVCWYRLDRDDSGAPLSTFTKHHISDRAGGHGLGFGDVDGDGRDDIVVGYGWFKAPEDRINGVWELKEEFQLGSASIPILVHDVNGDGRADLIWGAGHDYGLYWLEQGTDEEGKRVWTKHAIDTSFSQVHFLALVDLDQDGDPELVTGKRYKAHTGHDPGTDDPQCVYYYEMDLATAGFARHDIDVGNRTGIGLQTGVGDVNGDGKPDLACPAKSGLFLFVNLGK
jgi:hypothetical protein